MLRRVSDFSFLNYYHYFLATLIPGLAFRALPVAPAIDIFDEITNGGRRPNFLGGTLQQAAKHAQRELKFLFVYIHDPAAADSTRFCHDTLASGDFVSFANDNLVLWMASIRTSEGRQAAQALQARVCPFSALLITVNEQVQAVFRQEGYIPALLLIETTASHMERNQIILETAASLRTASTQAQAIREEQDSVYLATLRADQLVEENRLKEIAEQESKSHRERDLREKAAQEVADAELRLKQQQEVVEEGGRGGGGRGRG